MPDLSFPLNTSFATGAVTLDLDPALAGPGALLPAVDTVIASANISAAPGNPISFGPAKVGFSADANASLGIFASPASVRTGVLDNAPLVADLADTVAFTGESAAAKFLLLRWGYDISANVSGAVALAPAANLTFSGDAGSKGFYALVTAVQSDALVKASLDQLFSAWKLPSQVASANDLPPFTTLITEIDASFNVGAKVSFGYEFNWLRTVNGLGLSGDIGLKLETALSASIGFGMSGKYAIVLARESDAATLRMRLFKLKVSNLALGFDASVIATPSETVLPENFDDLLKAVLGVHGQQVMKLLGRVEDWVDPSKPIFGPFVDLADTEAQKLIESITGVSDLSAAFDEVKGRIQKVFTLWDGLPQSLTRLIWSKLPESDAISSVATIANKVATLDAAGLTTLLETSLGGVPFLGTTQGQALEAMAVNGLFSALQDNAALAEIQKAAGLVTQILDGDLLQSFLTKLQAAVNTRLDLAKLESVVDQTSFDSLDTWLKARLENFLEQDLVGAQGLAEITKLRSGLKAILDKKDELYAKALSVLNRDYNFAFHATYQSTATDTALMDVSFDFGAGGSQATSALKLALGGKFDTLLSGSFPGVTINQGVLSFGIRKESHVSLTLPYFSTESTHVNDAVAQLSLNQDEGGLIYSLSATDLYTIKNDFSSALAIAVVAPAGPQNTVNVHTTGGSSYRYDLKVNVPNLTAQGLSLQYAPYANVYFPSEFRDASPGTFADWVGQIAPADGSLGNALLSLSLSLPPSALQAWLKAPDNNRDPIYKSMSIALQKQFKQVLHDAYFNDIHNYANVSGDTTARAVLTFCSIPPCSDVEFVDNGEHIQFLDADDNGKDIYWDYSDRGVNVFSVDLREKVLFHPQTQTNLLAKLAIARTRLQAAGDPDRVLPFYADQPGLAQILGAALHGNLLNFLFPVESHMVEQARAAGLRMASFRNNQFANPAQARKDLAQFGQTLSSDFNTNLKVFAVNNALLPLGTAIYVAAATALDPDMSASQAAMFTIQTLRAGISTITPQQTDILRTQVVVHSS